MPQAATRSTAAETVSKRIITLRPSPPRAAPLQAAPRDRQDWRWVAAATRAPCRRNGTPRRSGHVEPVRTAGGDRLLPARGSGRGLGHGGAVGAGAAAAGHARAHGRGRRAARTCWSAASRWSRGGRRRSRELAAVLDDVDLVVADNICSLPMNRAVGEALADYLRGRPAVLRHHDLPWERPQYAHLTSWPADDPAWWHVTINELARHALAARRGIAATTIYHGFAERPCPEQRAAVRRRIRVGDGPLVLQPTRAIPRKGIDVGLALTAAVGGTYWLTGPAEDGYQAELSALLDDGGVPYRRRLPFGVQMAGRLRGVRRRGDAVVVGGVRAAADRGRAAPPSGRGRDVPGGRASSRRSASAGSTPATPTRCGRSSPTPMTACWTTTRRSRTPTSASTRSPAVSNCCSPGRRCAPTPAARPTSATASAPRNALGSQHLRQERLRALLPRVGQHLARVPGLDDPAARP